MARFKPDLVVALPRPDRASAEVGRLLDLGVPLFAKKPLGVRASDTWSLVDRAEWGWVTVAFSQRYLPIWTAVKRLQAEDRLGTIGHVGMRQIAGPPWRYQQYEVPWMLDPAIAGGGPLRNTASTAPTRCTTSWAATACGSSARHGRTGYTASRSRM